MIKRNGRGRTDMMAWLPVVALAVVQVTVRLLGVAAMIWQERVRANSHCAQMRAASESGVVLLARRRDSSALVIVPLDLTSRGGDVEADPDSEEAPVA
jgi:hypothetical protein